MAIDLDDEIVQAFLLESGEILDELGRQLVDLEQRPDDRDLLNPVFRGFHTIKGGAGFLGLDNLVELSHQAEDVFDLLRKGRRRVDAALMDVVLRVLDVLNVMFEQMRAGTEPSEAPRSLVVALRGLAQPDDAIPNTADKSAKATAPASVVVGRPRRAASDGTATADTRAPGVGQPRSRPISAEPEAPLAPEGSSSEEISEAEFEALLDELCGQKTPNGRQGTERGSGSNTGFGDGDKIAARDFDKPLDELHDNGRHGRVPARPAAIRNVETTQRAARASHPSAAEHEMGRPVPPEADTRQASSRRESFMDEGPLDPTWSSSGTPGKGGPTAPADSTVRVETSVLDRIMNMVGELVLIRNRISTLEAAMGDEEMTKTASILDVVTSDLQAAIMKTRMQPVKKIFGRFPRVVRDLARNLKKQVRLELQGQETDLDKNLVEALADPLIHLVRNAVDHGIETPDVRERSGKPRAGTLLLAAERAGDHILLTISDDGAGMDPEVLRRKAVDKSLMDEDAAGRLDERACYELIFVAGFSTRNEISDVSGRGVGMDVVKTRINQLNGTIDIDSKLGKGTSIYIKLPLTLAIVPTLMVVLGKQIFALPLVNVNEIIDLDLSKTNAVDGQEVMVVRGRVLPLFYLRNWLIEGAYEAQAGRGYVVIVTVGTHRMGLLVDQLIGQEEVVIKPLGALLQGTKGLAGATITGDGRIALILDLPGLLSAYARRM